MERRPLGRTGIDVPRVALGCGNFGGVGSAPHLFGAGESEEEAFALMDQAWAAGISLFDTADAYGGGRSERYIGSWLRRRGIRREQVLLATKVFHSVTGDPADRGLAPARIRRQLAGSLERLGVDHVDLYLVHAWDDDTPVGETLSALDELVRDGLVRAVGASNVAASQVEEALHASADAGVVRFEWVQNAYSLLEREAASSVLPLCERHGLGFTPFGPLAGGWLTGKYRRGGRVEPGSRMALRPEGYERFRDDRVYEAVAAFVVMAAARGVDAATLAHAWVLSDPRVTSVVVGPRRPAHLEPVLRALELELSAKERDELASLFPELGGVAG